MVKFLVASVFLCCLATTTASAVLFQQSAIRDTIINDTLVYRIDPVIAFGRVSAKEVQQRAFVLSPKEIRSVSNESAADLVRDVPSGFVQTNSRGESLVYLRGSGERQTAVLFDGALINVPWDNRVDLSFVPISMVQYMTVVPGTMSILYGPNTLGGAVSLTGQEFVNSPWSGSLETSVSDGGGLQLSSSVTHRTGQWNLSGFAETASRSGHLRADGEGLITNSASSRFMGMARALYKEDTFSASLTAMRVSGDKGVTPEAHVGEDARFWKYSNIERTLVIGNVNNDFDRETNLRVSLWADAYEQQVDAYTSRLYDTLSATEEGIDNTFGARVLFEHAFSKQTHIDVASTWFATQHTTREYDAGATGEDIEYASVLGSSVVELSHALTSDIRVFAGIGIDLQSPSETGNFSTHASVTALQGTAGVSYQLSASDALMLAVGKRNRFATAREQYSGALGKFTPNTELGPESGLTSEFTYTYSDIDALVVATGFYTRYNDGISRLSLEDGTFTRVNIKSSAIGGVSLFGEYEPWEYLVVDGHVTWITQTTDDEIEYIEYRPELLGVFAVTYDNRSVRVRLDAEYTGSQYGQDPFSDEFVEVAPSTLVGFRTTYTMMLEAAILAVEVSLENVFDTATLFQLGLERPGRTLSIGFTYTY